MSAKNKVIGTAKQIVAEIVGDGRLAEEGGRQALQSSTPHPAREQTLSSDTTANSQMPQMDEKRFATLLGHAALEVWADLPRDAQERLFAAAAGDGVVATDLAGFLHDRHPRTAPPPRPTRFA